MTLHQPSSQTAHRDPALDGLRGIAVLMVFLFHYGGGLKSPHLAVRLLGYLTAAGWTGVVLFFTLSGFLITGSLWDSRGNQHWFRNFYARRFLRILPLYYTALALSAIGLFEAWHNLHLLQKLFTYVLFLQNMPWLEPTALAIPTPLPLYHLWSMAVEEQFYLLWPCVLLMVRNRRSAFRLCVWVFVASAAFRVVIFGLPQISLQHSSPYRDFLLTHAGEFALGACLAFAWRDPEDKSIARFALPALLIGLAVYVLSSLICHGFSWDLNLQYVLGLTGASLAAVALLALALRDGVWRHLCSMSALRFLGRISYGFYIFHILLQGFFDAISRHIVHTNSGSSYQIARLLVAFPLSILVSWISFHLLETPFLRLKRHFPMKPPLTVE
ncbi:acyltransferase [Granulicella sp. S156]|jgi:peptidoglycan/LPS O-acetylase OafA/YrhL|uniref:acyltransferase family protein n=1 Tax=Granulicella sp. S156 TaxID=1747224 RepID=UPI00131E9623|nr:acyltransferase [Granulicella sp. S156]